MSQQNNGRVLDSLYGDNYNIYDLFKEDRKPSLNFNEEAIKGTHWDNDISRIFFSKQNIDVLQDAIRYQVYTKSCKKHVIDKQSETELKLIMRAIYLEKARHATQDILAEVRRLNSNVLDFCVPKILQEINIYMYYRDDISHLPVPLERGQFSSSKGQKVLETKQF